MQGQKSYLNVRNGEKSGFMGEIQQSKFQQQIEEKDKEIAKLTKAIKRLKKELKEKEEGGKMPANFQGNNGYFKSLLQREVSRYNQLREIVLSVTDRIRKLSQEINCEFSIFQNSVEMENLVKMLETANIEGSKSSKSLTSERSGSISDEDTYVQQAVDQFEVVIRGFMMKHGQTNKLYKQSLQIQKQLQEELSSCKKELKMQKKSKDLLQKLLEKNQTQKNEIVNQINNMGNQQQLQDLKNKSKEEILLHYLKLNYRIKDLQKQKQEYIKSSTKDKQKQVKLYEALLCQVKGIKERNRIRQSVA